MFQSVCSQPNVLACTGWILREEARQMEAEDADARSWWRLGNLMGGGWTAVMGSSSSSYRTPDAAEDGVEDTKEKRGGGGEEGRDQLTQYEARGVFEEFWRYSPSFRLLSIRYAFFSTDKNLLDTGRTHSGCVATCTPLRLVWLDVYLAVCVPLYPARCIYLALPLSRYLTVSLCQPG